MDLAELLDILAVRPAVDDGPAGASGNGSPSTATRPAFEGLSPKGRARSIFGGQFLGQGLMAAGATVEPDRPPHSLHAYFIRSGDPFQPIRYEVDLVRDGRSFSHRQVVAAQDGKEVFRMLASFHRATVGPSHDDPTPVGDVDPASLVTYEDWAETGTDNPEHDVYTDPAPIELRYEDPPPTGPGQRVRGPQRIWARVAGPVADDSPLLHAALLAWLSDKTIADFSTLAHGRRWTDHGTDSISLDHAMWFLRPLRADDWLLYRQGAPSSDGGRAFTRGEFVGRDGIRLATVAQEVLLTLPG
jgi:acyl-CoA thioesterase-2